MNIDSIKKEHIYRFKNGQLKRGVNVMRDDEEPKQTEPSNKLDAEFVENMLLKLLEYKGSYREFAKENCISASTLSRYKCMCLAGKFGSEKLREKLM